MQNFIKNFSLFGLIKPVLSNISGLIYKQKCVGCGCSKDNVLLCKNCKKSIEFSTVYQQGFFENVKIFSAFPYKDIPKKLVHQLKFNHKKGVSKILAALLYEYFLKTELSKNDIKNFIIIPVPSHKQRVSIRGYCQTNLICEEFSRISDVKFNTEILKKIKNTKPQFKLNSKERRENLKDSFSLCLNNYNGENILLIDDITTTGATLQEIIKLFKKENITNLAVLTVCKT